MPLLEGKGITKTFGGIMALDHVSLSIQEGGIIGLIGPNGAGKTTLFNVLAGTFPPTSGSILFNGKALTGLPAFRICRMGIARTFQVPRPFPNMTCLENVAIGAINRHRRCTKEKWTALSKQSLETVGLSGFESTPARQLNVIQKKRLEIARAIVTEPRLLMLDEVLGGLNSKEIQEAVLFIQRLRDERALTILWIEHVMGAIMQAAEHLIVLDQGRVLMQGRPEEVVRDPGVIQAYLGD